MLDLPPPPLLVRNARTEMMEWMLRVPTPLPTHILHSSSSNNNNNNNNKRGHIAHRDFRLVYMGFLRGLFRAHMPLPPALAQLPMHNNNSGSHPHSPHASLPPPSPPPLPHLTQDPD